MNKKMREQFIPPIKEYSSRKEWEDTCWQKIIDSKEVISRIITPHERRNLIMRAAAIHRLRLGSSYREIGKELWLSPQTISGIKKSLDEQVYRSYSERSKKERKKKLYTTPEKKNHHLQKIFVSRRTKYGVVRLPRTYF